LIKGFLTKPSESIAKLGPVDDPMIGVFVHWTYGPHTCDGVVGKNNPLLLASNFSGTWPGLVALLNTGACLESLKRPFSRIWTSHKYWTKDKQFMERLEQWCSTGQINYPTHELHHIAPISEAANKLADAVYEEVQRKRILALMLGDTSMGMINGYFGPRVLARLGFAEHKVDQSWISVRIRIVRAVSAVTLKVEDRGGTRAADMAKARADDLQLGVGVMGMRERMRQLGGHLAVSFNGSGTVVAATLPLGRPDPEAPSEAGSGTSQPVGLG